MADSGKQKRIQMRYRGRIPQVLVYFGKFLRIFIYQNDWKVLPMAAVIAGMVSIVIRRSFNVTMEGTLLGALALSCVAIWNGCFNSIQVICRERNIIKREHRSGMHVSAYVMAHLLFQMIICLMQTGITLYVCGVTGVKLAGDAPFTGNMALDLGITIFLITFAADTLSLFISAISRTTMTAMTIMPFVLIFQLVFSGGMFTLPGRLQGLSSFTISHYGMRCVAAQAHYNDLPLMSGWDTLSRMRNSVIDEDVTVDQVMDFLTEKKSSLVTGFTDAEVGEGETLRDVLREVKLQPSYQDVKDETYNIHFTIGDVIDLVGEKELKAAVTDRGREAAYSESYELSRTNIIDCWISLITFAAAFTCLTILVLEFIDRDKR